MFFLLMPVAAVSLSVMLVQAPETSRTVTYYANNPYVREKVLKQCYDDPGHLAFNPDCVNAKKGDIADAVKKGSGLFFHGQVPSPEYFSWDHRQRAATLGICRNMTPSQKVRYGRNCDDAEASIESDQIRVSGSLPQVQPIQ